MKAGKAAKEPTTIRMEGDRDLVVERVYPYPRDRVYAAFNDPELVPRWWGPARLVTTVVRMDVRVGGRWHIVQRDPDGTEFVFRGEYREIAPPVRVARTFEFDGAPGMVMIERASFEPVGSSTKVTVRSVFSNSQERAAMAGSGMEDGVREAFDRLDRLLAGR